MLKKFFLFPIFITLINFSFAHSNEKLVYLDITYILNQSKPAKSIIENIEKIQKKEISKLKVIEDDLQKENDEIIKTKNLVTKEEFNKKVKDFRLKLSSYDKKKKKVVSNLNQRKKDELNNLLSLINPIIEKYMNQNSIEIIIDKKNVYMAKSDNDITNEILELINKEIK